MATYIITRIHRELAPDHRHRHIAGVCTEDGHYYRRRDVVDSIHAGHTWKVRVAESEARIRVVSFCPHRHCLASPYIQAEPASGESDHLEHADEC